MLVDSALLQYDNRPLVAPRAAQAQAPRREPSSGLPQVQGTGAKIAPDTPIDKKSPLYAQCLDFESIFVKMMLKEMRATVDKSADIMSGGFAGDIYQDMLDDEYAKSMSKTADFGLADNLYRQLSRVSVVQNSTS